MAIAHAQAGGQSLQGPWAIVGGALIHPGQGLVRQHVAGILGGPTPCLAGRQFGAATQTRPETRPFGLGRVGEKVTISRQGCARFAHRPAVNAGALHAKEKKPVKAGIARAQSLVAGAGVQGQVVGGHAGMLRTGMGVEWSVSDMVMGAAAVLCLQLGSSPLNCQRAALLV